MSENNRFLPLIILILLTLMWGSSFILIKRSLEAFGPLEVGALRISAAGLALLPFALPRIKRLRRRHWKLLLAVGFTGTFIPAFLFATAQLGLKSSVAGILNALTPFFVMIIGAIFFRQKFERSISFGLIVGFMGSLMLMLQGDISGLSGFNHYSLYIILATVCYGTNLNVIKFHINDLSALTITSISVMMVLPLALGFLFLGTDFLVIMAEHPKATASFGYVVLLGVMSTAIALILYNRLVQLTTPIFTSSVTYLIPIVAVGWGLLDGEELTIFHYMGMLLIISGIYLINYVRINRSKKPIQP